MFALFQIYRIKKEEFVSQNTQKLLDENDTSEVFEKPQILIDRLLRLVADGKIDDQTAIDEVETMLIGGTETSALTSSFVILLLAMNPDVQEQAYHELHSVYKSQDEETTNEHIQSLSYLDRVVKEGMRLFPAGPFLVRHASANIQISNCIIPKNTYVLLSIFNLHRVRIHYVDFSLEKIVENFFLRFSNFFFVFFFSFKSLILKEKFSIAANRCMGKISSSVQSGQFFT